MSASVFSTLSGVLTGKHPELGILCRETGEVFVPASAHHKAHWTYGYKDPKGYLHVKINGKPFSVHRLICQTFHDNPLNLPTVDHYPDRNPSNNHASNLRFASYSMQNSNKQIVEDSLAKYGVRSCKDKNAYRRALRAKNPEYAEQCRARSREYYANNPEYSERERVYHRERYANDPEYANRQKALKRERYANDPEYAERCRAKKRELRAKQRALGKHDRRCPDGKRRLLTDEEYDKLYGK